MTKESIFEKLRDILADLADIDREDIRPDSEMVYDIGLDSMEILKLISAIEKEYSIQIPVRMARTFVTVQDMADYTTAAIVEKG